MEWFIIEYYKAAIKKHNEENKDNKEKTIKNELSTYSAPWKQIMWGLLGFSVVALVFFCILVIKLSANMQMKTVEFYIYVASFPCAIVAMLLFLVFQSFLSKRFAKENINIHKLRLSILEEVIKDVYGEENLREKVESLAEIYKNKVLDIEREDSRRHKVAWVILSLVGTIAAVSIANLDKIGIDFTEWIQLILIMMVIALFFTAPLYLASLINPTKDKYNLMVDRLCHLKILLISEEDKKTKEPDENSAKAVVPSIKTIDVKLHRERAHKSPMHWLLKLIIK